MTQGFQRSKACWDGVFHLGACNVTRDEKEISEFMFDFFFVIRLKIK
jgi:hypothetical protein